LYPAPESQNNAAIAPGSGGCVPSVRRHIRCGTDRHWNVAWKVQCHLWCPQSSQKTVPRRGSRDNAAEQQAHATLPQSHGSISDEKCAHLFLPDLWVVIHWCTVKPQFTWERSVWRKQVLMKLFIEPLQSSFQNFGCFLHHKKATDHHKYANMPQ